MPRSRTTSSSGRPGRARERRGRRRARAPGTPSKAERFVEFLLSPNGQRFYVDAAEEAEYPLVEGIEAKEGLPPLDELEGPNVDLTSFGAEHEATIELLRETGYLT